MASRAVAGTGRSTSAAIVAAQTSKRRRAAKTGARVQGCARVRCLVSAASVCCLLRAIQGWEDFFRTIANRMAPPIFDTLLRGPKVRGPREPRVFKAGQQTDVYGALLHTIAHAGKPAVSSDELMRILERDLVETPSNQTVGNSLGHMSTIAAKHRGDGDSALAFKNETLNVLDPFFLFYLRYGDWTVEKSAAEEEGGQYELPIEEAVDTSDGNAAVGR